ncbi:MAG: hypothetical protein O7D86_13285 [Proteobacteria bacterium]|nr:hypothetical protein [Pseudomonadota bacterium]
MNEQNIGNTNVIDLNVLEAKINASMGKYANAKFRPFAYYDKHLDCIRVVTRDCSVCESRIDHIFTILEDNYPKTDQYKYVGFTIKGVRHLLQNIGIIGGPHIAVTKILDSIVNSYPEGTVDLVVNTIARPIAETERLTVDLPVGIESEPLPA